MEARTTMEITTKGIIISSNSSSMETIRMLISKDKDSNIITIFMVVDFNTTTVKTTKANGRTTVSNSSITITSNKWINHHLLLIKTITSHFTQTTTTSSNQCTETKSKTSKHFTLSQTPTPIAFIHDKFTTVTNNKVIISRIKSRLPAMGKCRLMVSIFQQLLPFQVATLVVAQGRSSRSSFQMVV